MWKEGSKILFECKVKETGALCLTGGWIELRYDGKEVMSSTPKLGLKSESIFDELQGSSPNQVLIRGCSLIN